MAGAGAGAVLDASGGARGTGPGPSPGPCPGAGAGADAGAAVDEGSRAVHAAAAAAAATASASPRDSLWLDAVVLLAGCCAGCDRGEGDAGEDGDVAPLNSASAVIPAVPLAPRAVPVPVPLMASASSGVVLGCCGRASSPTGADGGEDDPDAGASLGAPAATEDEDGSVKAEEDEEEEEEEVECAGSATDAAVSFVSTLAVSPSAFSAPSVGVAVLSVALTPSGLPADPCRAR